MEQEVRAVKMLLKKKKKKKKRNHLQNGKNNKFKKKMSLSTLTFILQGTLESRSKDLVARPFPA